MTSFYPINDSDRLLTPREVAEIFRVDPKTVTRWAKAGRFDKFGDGVHEPVVRTLGGHRRFNAAAVARAVQVGSLG
jgi:predicted site-specific integrase-resolvase